MEHTEQEQNVIVAALTVYVGILCDVAERAEGDGDLATFVMYDAQLAEAFALLDKYRN
jgi:hypothetical protein